MKTTHIVWILITGISLLWAGTATSQTTKEIITGRVLEAGTNKPIRNASIYFDGTLNSTTSDSTGSFTLYPQANRNVPIIVNAMGYDIETIKDLSAGKKVIVYLNLKKHDLETVTVKANDGMSRAEKLRIFRREFLGSSPNARSCEIINEDDLRFTYSTKTHILKASCDKALVIHNKNLGYTLNFLLSNFTYRGKETSFYGTQFFMEDNNAEDIEKVKKARKETYYGSRMHFIRSLWYDDLQKNAFRVSTKVKDFKYEDLIVIRDKQKFLHFNDSVMITYKWRTSPLYKVDSSKDVVIDKDGYSDPAGLVWGGLMGAQRAGDLLPLEYSIKDKHRDNNESANTGGAMMSASSQTGIISDMITSIDTLRSRMPEEKLYIQFDKPYYITGDTIRMKAYLFDAALLKASDKSGIVYIELANDTNKVLFRRMLPVGYGLGTGNIILNKEDIPEGSYTIRAYTNLMRNFGEDLVFKKDFYISGNAAQNWLVNSQTVLSKQAGKDNIRLGLQFSDLSKQALSNRELDLRVLDGKRVIQRDKVKTDIDGKLDVNFNLPEKSAGNDLTMLVTDANHKMTIPVTISRQENIDLQFMPEGGNLVAWLPAVIGFKAIGEDGKGVNVTGKVYGRGNEEVATFSSSNKGMGSFELTPKEGETYTAKVILNGTEKSFPLPSVKSAGTVMRIINNAERDSVEVLISSASAVTDRAYYLTVQSRGIICYGAVIRFNANAINTRKIAKGLFPTGIARFTLMNADKQTLNERIIFIDHHDNLDITLQPSQEVYQTRDSITLAIEVENDEGVPVEGSFSLAVTDDRQIRTDSLSSNLLTSLLLTSDLKGTIEDPGHYFQQTLQAQKDLDNLLLTQGWIGYDWKDIFNPPEPQYAAEPEFVLTGKVTNAFNKGSAVTGIQLMSLKPSAVKIGQTAADGSFSFRGLPVAEDMKFFLKAKNKNNKSFNVGIGVDEFKPAVFKTPARHFSPWYVNADTLLLRQAIMRAIQEAKLSARGTNLLEEVTITAKKFVKDSKNLNGAGEADQILDEKDMAKDPKRSLLDLMNERVKGFNVGIWPSKNVPAGGVNSLSVMPPTLVSGPGGMGLGAKTILGTSPLYFEKTSSYRIDDKEMHLVIDGIDVESLYYPDPGYPFPTSDKQLVLQRKVNPSGDYILERNAASPDHRMNFIRLFLDGILAEDVKGIEVMSDPKFNARYKSQYAGKILASLSVAGPDFAYVEVTTYSGNGAFVKTPPGVYLHKPLSYVNSAAFYRPRYAVKTNPLSDFRSVIHWEPDIVTDKDGKAIVSFYSADRPGTYSIIMEGSDMKGAVGRKTGTITIK